MRQVQFLLAAATLLCMTIGSGFLWLALLLQGEILAAFAVLAAGMGCLAGAILLVVLAGASGTK